MSFSPPADVVRVPAGYPTVLIYVDESAVKASGGRFFVVGAVKVRKSGQLMRAIRDIRDRHGFHDEFKFSRRCSQSFGLIAAHRGQSFGLTAAEASHIRNEGALRFRRAPLAFLGSPFDLCHTRLAL